MVKTRTLDFFYKKIDHGNANHNNLDPLENISTEIQDNEITNINKRANSNATLENPSKVQKTCIPLEDNSYSLERDPALRKQIYEYSNDEERNKIRLEYARLKAFQPIYDNYPLSGPENHRRSFQSSWFKEFPWLEYSPSKDAAFCFPCFLFCTKPKGCFTHDGFNKWKKVNSGKYCAFLVHMGKGPNSEHKKLEKSLLDLMKPNQRIEAILLRQTAEEIRNNRLRLEVSIKVARWLTFQNCPFRGHDESENSENRGNFIELIKFAASFDKKLENVILQNAPGNAQYTSSTIQKEIMHILASKVRGDIRKEIGEAKFCVILDESQDISLREQMAIVLRFVDSNGVLKERFLDLVHVKDTTSLTLQQALYQVLTFHNLNVKNIRGQGYDGASNMRVKFNGLKALLLNDSPYAYYVHCFAHRLQLALVGATREVIPIDQFFTKLGIIINLVGASSKRHDELRGAQQVEINNMIASDEGIETRRGLNQIGSLQRAGETRWSSHLNSINSLLKLFKPTGKVLQTIITEGNRTQRAEADAAYDTLMSYEFVFLLHLMKNMLSLSDNLNQALQRRTQDIVNAMSLVSTTKELIQNLRDNGWDGLLIEVASFCEKNNVELPNMATLYTAGKGRSRLLVNMTLEHHYRVDLFTAAIDSQLQEISARFDDQMIDLLLLSSALDPKDSFMSFDIDKICLLVDKHYPDDFSTQEKCRLPFELQHFQADIQRNPELQKLCTLSQLSKVLVDTGKANAYPLVDRMVHLVLTLPVSTATCERAFSAMSIVKTTLRNRMEDDFLSNILVVYIEKGLAKNYDLDSLIDDFASMKVRRVQFK